MKDLDVVDLEHRLTVLETEMSQLAKINNENNEELKKLLLQFSKYERRWGNILMIGTALWSVFAVFKDEILRFLGIRHD